MFRQSMPADHGMLFDFASDIAVTMWMKNTYILARYAVHQGDGTIHRIERRTEPHVRADDLSRRAGARPCWS
jgi:uncharacterized membrane protein (UPF0127 family)